MTNTRMGAFSANIRLSLQVNGDTISVAQTGPSTLILRGEYKSYEPCEAVLTISINDATEHQKIFLPEGIDPSSQCVNYSRLSA